MEERGLAYSVIELARKDFINKKSSQSTIYECHEFLTGRGPMSKFWFDLAELNFLKGGIKALRVKLTLVEHEAQLRRDEVRRIEKRKPRKEVE